MPVTGAHVLLYTPEAEALRAALEKILVTSHVDAGGGWLIFALPPAELAAHPTDDAPRHELSLMCDDLAATKAELEAEGIAFRGEPQDMGFGVGVTMVLPGNVDVLLYAPRHPTAI